MSRGASVLGLAFIANIAFASQGFVVPSGTVPSDELDSLPMVAAPAVVIYPKELCGSGLVGHVSALVILYGDGSKADWVVDAGMGDSRFASAVEATMPQWRFTSPTKDGRPVETIVSVSVTVSEHGLCWPIVRPVRVKLPSRPEAKAGPDGLAQVQTIAEDERAERFGRGTTTLREVKGRLWTFETKLGPARLPGPNIVVVGSEPEPRAQTKKAVEPNKPPEATPGQCPPSGPSPSSIAPQL